MAYTVSPSDIEARWRALDGDETDVARTLITDCTTKIDLARPTLAAAVTAATVSQRIVTMTVCDIVIRVLANPDGARSQGIAADGSITVGYGWGDSAEGPRVVVTDEDLIDIDRALAAANVGPRRFTSRYMVAYPE